MTVGERAPLCGERDFHDLVRLQLHGGPEPDTLQSGTRSDDHAYAAELLPRGWALLETLLDRADATQKADDTDPMSAAINSPKGRTIEAAMSHALRACRLADKESGSHAAAWAGMRELFDRELQKTLEGNYEFSTLLGAYFANLDYVDEGWVGANLAAIFPVQQPQFLCAIGGLAYASATIRVYDILRDARVIEAALRSNVKGRETRKMRDQPGEQPPR